MPSRATATASHLDDRTYVRKLGKRLHAVRQQQALSLHDVQERSGGEFKTSVLGAYERGDRRISVSRLQRLARVYGVPIELLLPVTNHEPGVIAVTAGEPAPGDGVCVDLQALRCRQEPEAQALRRHLARIRRWRGDFNGRVLTIRRDDLRALAAALGHSPESLTRRLDALGLRLATT
jgi:transcriptional regulator with XRE-family HTH domain